jgi:hypothetical protein
MINVCSDNEMDISLSGIIASIVFSGVGLWLFRQGKQRANIPLVLISIAMMLYTYFTSGPWADWGVGVLLCFAARYFWYRD